MGGKVQLTACIDVERDASEEFGNSFVMSLGCSDGVPGHSACQERTIIKA